MTHTAQKTSNKKEFKLALPTTLGIYYFSPEQIVRLESCSNYTNIFFTDRKPILASKVLKQFEDTLAPFGFLRIHRSHLVNRKYVKYINHKGDILMQDSSTVEISRRKKGAVIRQMNCFLAINTN